MFLLSVSFKVSSNVNRVRQVNEGYVKPTQVNRVTTVRSVLFEAVGSTATALRAIRNLSFRFAAIDLTSEGIYG